jgi:hypothetical protein
VLPIATILTHVERGDDAVYRPRRSEMIAAFHSWRGVLMRTAFQLLATAAFAFLAAVVVGGANPSLIAAVASFSIVGLLAIGFTFLGTSTEARQIRIHKA